MKVYLGADKDGITLKNSIKEALIKENFDVTDLAKEPFSDFVDSAVNVAEAIKKEESLGKSARGILFDKYGDASFIACSKIPGMIVAEVSEERSAYMTRQHNNAKVITMGQEIVGTTLAINIAKSFLKSDYDGGRHQIRVDMLNAMC